MKPSAVIYAALLLAGLASCQENRPPQWRETLQNRLEGQGVSESLQTGSQLGTLQAVDPEGGQVMFYSQSNVFVVDRFTGLVTLGQSLDRERAATVPVRFSAEDSAGNRVTISYSARVLDVNDNVPKITGGPFFTLIVEGDNQGLVIYDNILVKDADEGQNAIVDFSCRSTDSSEARLACDTFRVTGNRISDGVYRGFVSLRRRISNRNPARYTMTIAAEDRVSGRAAITQLVIDVVASSEAPPRILNMPIRGQVDVNTRQGTTITEVQISFTPSSSGNLLNVTMKSDSRGYFTLTPLRQIQSGVFSTSVQLRRSISTTEEDDSFWFQLSATEENGRGQQVKLPSVSLVVVSLSGASSKAPQFTKSRYHVEVMEGLPKGSTLPGINIVVSDNDEGDDGYYRLSIIDAQVYSFSLVPTEGRGTTAVSLVVDEPTYLDYEYEENRMQTFTILAQETKSSESLSSTTLVTVALIDKNDNSPTFARREYSNYIREDRAVGFVITRITATDRDSGTYGTITYSFTGEGSQYFNVDSTSGEITLRQRLTSSRSITATYRATDGGGLFTEATFRVTVRSYNQQGPSFLQEKYEAYIQENSLSFNPPLRITAENRVNPDLTYKITYRIIDGNTPDNAFTINTQTGEMGFRRRVARRDTYNQQGFFQLVVEASDNGAPAITNTVLLTIYFREARNNPPKFPTSLYLARIQEQAPPATSVAQVTATDNDGGRDGDIRYSIHSGHRNNFVINPITGLIQVSQIADLDTDRSGQQYSLAVHAVDQGDPPLTGTTTVQVTVDDSNSRPPEFTQDLYQASIVESAPRGRFVVQVSADDPDSSSDIRYSLDESTYRAEDPNGRQVVDTTKFDYKNAFYLNVTTGVITTVTRLNHDHVAKVSFKVKVVDLNAQGGAQQDTATVEIEITPSGTRNLKFADPWTPEKPYVTVEFKEEELPGSIVTALVAKDDGTGEPAKIYEKLPGGDPNNFFYVNYTNGEITLANRVDFEKISSKIVSFQMKASTDRPVIRTALATVNIRIMDINDQSPQFDENVYDVKVSELARYPTVIGQVRATDADTGPFAEIRYSISGPGSGRFFMNPINGNLTVNPSAILDRENRDFYSLLVTAEDNPSAPTRGQRRTTVPLDITVLDENDNSPVFKKTLYDLHTLGSVKIGMKLGQVQAEDADEGNNGKIRYSFRPASVFFTVDDDGFISTKVELQDHSRAEPYELTLIAEDMGNPMRSGQTNVHIYVQRGVEGDIGIPRITEPKEDGKAFEIEEEMSAGIVVTQMKASGSPGSNPGGPVVYSLLHIESLTDHAYFTINPETGVIRTTKILDRETDGNDGLFELVVEVRDKNVLNPKAAIRTLFVKLKDIDDNEPTFKDCKHKDHVNQNVGYVQEEEEPNQSVMTVKACDADGPPNDKLYYYITCGNKPLVNGKVPFYINHTTGEIKANVMLDRETKSLYKLCIHVDSDADYKLKPEHANPNTTDPTVYVVYLYVEDKDDNEPEFIKDTNATQLTAYVSASAPYYSQVAVIQAKDDDLGSNARIKFSIYDIYFHRDGKKEYEGDTFIIEDDTGILRTNKNNFIRYTNGYFIVRLMASSEEGRSTKADMVVYVIQDNQQLKFIFDRRADQVAGSLQDFLDEISPKMDGAEITYTMMKYHMEFDGSYNFNRVGQCFYIVKDNRVLSSEEAMDLVSYNRKELRDIYNKYSVGNVRQCGTELTTQWWSGYYWMWWVLVASALFIIVVCILLIVILCLIYGNYHILSKRAVGSKFLSADPLARKHPDFVWQEKKVKMR